MMIVMTPDATEAQIAAVVERVTGAGARPHVIRGEELTVVAAIGDHEHVARLELDGAPGVDHMVAISKPYKLASSQ
ncbi:MAG: 3-deoxy-7-phosphoheptulonate synthase, partial [Solirubrobacteraceae bacterium]